MKNTFLILVLIALYTLSYSQSEKHKVKWYTLEEAQKLNAKNPKKIIIDVYTDWCGWCKKMDQATFGNPAIAKYLNDNYYPVKCTNFTRKLISL